MITVFAILFAQPQSAWANRVLPTEEDYFAAIPRVSSAARLEKSVFELGASVTIIDRDMIEASSAIEIPDLLRMVPGFQVSHTNGARFSVTYHGAADAWPRRMEVMVDGRSVYHSNLSAVEWSALGIAMDDIERIEVVRGPNAPTFGSNAMTGSINIVTRAAFLLAGKYLRTTFGSIDTENVVTRWGGGIGDWDISLTAQYRSDDGFEGVNDHKQITDLRFHGDYFMSPSDNLSIRLGFTGGDAGADGIPDYPVVPFRDRNTQSNYQQITWDRDMPGGERFKLNVYHHEQRLDDGFLLDMSIFGLAGTTVPLGFDVSKARRVDLEFQHNLAQRDDWRLAWGFGGRYDELSSDMLLAADDGQVERSSVRLFGSLEWQLAEGLQLNLDALTEIHESYGSETSPRIALNWLASDNRSFRVSASHNYRVQSLRERFMDYPITPSVPFPPPFSYAALYKSVSRDDFKPEQITAFEIGYTENWSELGLFLDLRLFHEKYDDMGWHDRVSPPATPGKVILGKTLYVIDAGGGWNTTGFDLQVDYRLTPDTRLVGAYSYAEIDGEIYDKTATPPPIITLTDTKSMNDTVPQHTLSLLLSHQFNPKWGGSLTLHHMDGVEWLGDGSEVEHYTRLDLKLTRNFRLGDGDGQIALIVQNLEDDEYNEFRVPGTHDRMGNVLGRRAYLQMSMQFN